MLLALFGLLATPTAFASEKLPGTTAHTSAALSGGLKTCDGTHFGTAGQIELGKRYAKAMRKLQAGLEQTGKPLR